MQEKPIFKPEYLSLTTLQLLIGYLPTDRIFSTATGFIYQYEEKLFLITNWHNVSGRHPITKEPLSKVHSGIPDVFITYLRLKDKNGQARLTKIHLYNDEESESPKWLIHPFYKEKVDVVAIPLSRDQDLWYYPINKCQFDDDIPPEVCDDVFVLGYPFEDLRELGLPIWKKGSIASDPFLNENQLPQILIDTATRPGLSGSPVIFQRVGVHRMRDGQLQADTMFGRIRGFLGIYSGRIGIGEDMAQLGIVWKKNVIEEIIKGKVNGESIFNNDCQQT